jgi:hypothetical protein
MITRLFSLKYDLLAFWILVTTSLCLGLLLNQFRDEPLPLVYLSKTERMGKSVSKMTVELPVAAPELKVLPKTVSLNKL